MFLLPPCGLGGSQSDSGPCTGSLGNPSDAGSGAFGYAADHSGSVILSILAAGAILAGVLFARWASRRVGLFFGDRRRAGAVLAAERCAEQSLFESFDHAAWHNFQGDDYDRQWGSEPEDYADGQIGSDDSCAGQDDREADEEDDEEDDGSGSSRRGVQAGLT